ncbi:MAG: carboxypeptidase-like regulatory domain-containing protein, partial [Bacteroidota bacterium]|nr:carboxypeptidase-like regulatory domain-containing protein [Bacteroidota bacterium]
MKRWYAILLLLLFPVTAIAGSTGKIAGKIVDARTGEGIPGVNVILTGTTLGAASNLDGEYSIINVPPGTYELKATAIGYAPVTVRDVRVNIDLTTRINIELGETVLELEEEVVITATRPLVRKDLTASTAVVGSEEIEALPVTEVSEVLNLQAGYIDGHVRGGRQGEVAYWIDGVPVTDVYDGGTVVEVNKNQVQELQLVSGAFNAEYGQALSGIVNIATKDGSNEFSGSFGTYFGDYVSGESDIFLGIDEVEPFAISNFDMSLSGPVLRDVVFFTVNGRINNFGGWLNGERRYNPSNVAYIDSAGQFVESRNPETGLGDGSVVEMNSSEKFYGQAKLNFHLTKGIKLWYQYIHDDVNYQDYNRYFVFNPDGNPTNYRLGQTHLAQLTHLLADNTFYTLALSLFDKNFQRYVYEDPFDDRYVHPNLLTAITPYSAATGGVDMTHFERNTSTLVGKFDITSQVTQQHLLKAGVQLSSHELYFNSIALRPVAERSDFDPARDDPFVGTRILDVSTIYHDEYTRKPMQLAAYAQDKMEIDDLIINLGIRLDV